MYIFILNMSFTSAPSCLSSLLPSSFIVYLPAPEEDNFLQKCSCTIVSMCFIALEYISLDLFYTSANFHKPCPLSSDP